jgi:hypothetical protein
LADSQFLSGRTAVKVATLYRPQIFARSLAIGYQMATVVAVRISVSIGYRDPLDSAGFRA